MPTTRRKLQPLLLALVLLGAFGVAVAAKPDGAALRSQQEIEERLLALDLEGLDRISRLLERSSERVDSLSRRFTEALSEDTDDPFDLDEMESDLREAESELRGHQDEFRKIRLRIIERRQRIALIAEQLAAVADRSKDQTDPLTGTWDLVVYPGPIAGTLGLELDGTLISGQYRLEGGWHGSVRGNLASGRVRLERWDSELGFDAVFYGQLSGNTVKGTWQANDLSAGRPTSGTWVATQRKD